MKQIQINGLDKYQTNPFGDQYLYLINGNLFETNSSQSVFTSHYGHLFSTDTLYVIAGTDSGLLPKWIKNKGLSEGSRYLFVELPEVIQAIDRNSIIEEPGFDLCTLDELNDYLGSQTTQRYAYRDRICLSSSQAVQHVTFVGYLAFWRQLSKTVEHFCWQMRNAFSLSFHTNLQLQNLPDNQFSATKLKDSFIGKTAVLLAGGPSLDNYIEWIKINRDKVVLAAVSRICRYLLAVNIKPDIIVSVDPYPYNIVVSKEIHAFEDSALLVNGNFLNPDLLSLWQGRKAYIGPRYPWKSESEPDYFSINGPTVSNIAYGLLIEMGFRQIILLGTDFCFSPEGYTHAKESAERDVGSMPMKGEHRIETNSGKSAETTNHYLLAAREMEEMAKDASRQGCASINPSPNAMKLKNITYSSLDQLGIDNLDEQVKDTIQQYIPLTTNAERRNFQRELLKEVDFALKEMSAINKLAKQALSCNRKIYANSKRSPDLFHKQKMDSIEDKINSKHSNVSQFVKRYGIQYFSAIIRTNSEKKRTHEETEIAGEDYYQAYIKTTSELEELLQNAQTRIMSRLEENKEPFNISKLLDLWEKTNQHGRALKWKNKNLPLIQQASEYDQNRFQIIEKQYQQILSDMESNLKSGTSIEASLVGTQGKAMECLIHKDMDGLRLIDSALETHHDKDQAQQLKQIIQAYLRELSGPSVEAIDCYETISEGPYKFDVLKRLLSLYLEVNNNSAALLTLSRLAEISTTFVPLLADMLSHMNEPVKAIELYTDYLLLSPGDLHSMFKLGKLYQQLGSLEGVEWAMQYILEKDPDFEEAKKLLAEAS